MKKIIILLFLGLFFISCTEKGEDWVLIIENEEGKVFIDNDSIGKISQNKFRVRIKNIYKKPVPYQTIKSESKLVESELAYHEWDCKEMKYRVLSINNYHTDNTNESVNLVKLDISKWHDIVPETVGFGVFKYICKNRK